MKRPPDPDAQYGVKSQALIHVVGEGEYAYKCPHCEKVWYAGHGRRVGFVVAAAKKHMDACRAITGIAAHFNLSYVAAKRKRLALWRQYESENPW